MTTTKDRAAVLLVALLLGCAARKPADTRTVSMAPASRQPAPAAQPRNAGIGVYIERQGPSFVITGVAPTGPAGRAGIVKGDVLIDVDGTATDPLTLEGVVERIRGVAGTTVVVTVAHEGAPRQVTMERAVIVAPSTPPSSSTGPAPEPERPATPAPPPSKDQE